MKRISNESVMFLMIWT